MVKVDPKLLQGRAYGLFFQEYRERIEVTEQLFAKGISQADRQHLSISFHKLKGGAGFFGFELICQLAAELELLFSRTEALAEHDLERAVKSLKDLKGLQLKLPEPVSFN